MSRGTPREPADLPCGVLAIASWTVNGLVAEGPCALTSAARDEGAAAP